MQRCYCATNSPETTIHGSADPIEFCETCRSAQTLRKVCPPFPLSLHLSALLLGDRDVLENGNYIEAMMMCMEFFEKLEALGTIRVITISHV